MIGTIETTNRKILEKFSMGRAAVVSAITIMNEIRGVAATRTGKKYAEAVRAIDELHLNIILDLFTTIESNYNLAIVSVLSEYYGSVESEDRKTKAYYCVITSENFISQINDTIHRIKSALATLMRVLQLHVVARADTKVLERRLNEISAAAERAQRIDIPLHLERQNFEYCKCGTKMTVVPELSELQCPSSDCGRIRTIIGAVFRDDQFYPQEGQKTKHGGYDTSRHYRFWIERLQALESKVFDDADLAKIEAVLTRDGYERRELTCEIIREVLKDPAVALTGLNDHAPLLVVTFGGVAPPRLNFSENKIISIRFSKAMRLYDIVNPDGGNKPYYPYFIYKLIEWEFRDKPQKLRLLNYIHLQSRETVIKNDKTYQKMCELAQPEDGLVYRPTDPAGRF
jgi:hypothetical protein